MEHLSNDHNNHLNQSGNTHKQCDETGYRVVNMMKSQWKPRQRDQNFSLEGKPL